MKMIGIVVGILIIIGLISLVFYIGDKTESNKMTVPYIWTTALEFNEESELSQND